MPKKKRAGTPKYRRSSRPKKKTDYGRKPKLASVLSLKREYVQKSKRRSARKKLNAVRPKPPVVAPNTSELWPKKPLRLQLNRNSLSRLSVLKSKSRRWFTRQQP